MLVGQVSTSTLFGRPSADGTSVSCGTFCRVLHLPLAYRLCDTRLCAARVGLHMRRENLKGVDPVALFGSASHRLSPPLITNWKVNVPCMCMRHHDLWVAHLL